MAVIPPFLDVRALQREGAFTLVGKVGLINNVNLANGLPSLVH